MHPTLTHLNLRVFISFVFCISNKLKNLLQRNQVGDGGATCIAEALKINQSLKQLNLSVNNIAPRGAAAISEALKINQSLKELDLSVSHTRKK